MSLEWLVLLVDMSYSPVVHGVVLVNKVVDKNQLLDGENMIVS
ncbi:MAG: hypothetical protein JWR26_3042 [Pedosphaera sp.]|nr:hypothetical protein [Pedosphaera sp.]